MELSYLKYILLLLIVNTSGCNPAMNLHKRNLQHTKLLPAVTSTNRMQDESCGHSSYPSSHDLASGSTINLDLPPNTRWNSIILSKKEHLHRLVEHVQSLLTDLFGVTAFSIINNNLPKLTETLPSPYKEEIYGIAEAGNLTISQVTLFNIFYEAFTVCTSIISEDDSGHIIHARNLDFGLFMGWDKLNHTWLIPELLRPLVLQLDWTKKNESVFKSVTFVGFLGVLTAMKPGKFSLSVNERFNFNGGYVGLLEWILFHDHRQRWVSFLARDVMESAHSYEEALDTLSQTRLLAPVYYILAGAKPQQGVIITRDRDNKNLLTLHTNETGQASWFLVETNYDHWEKAPFYDDRRSPAMHCLNEAGRGNSSLTLLYNVLSTKPVLNKLTTYTTLMSAERAYLKTWLRTCPDPCLPW